MQHHTPTRPMSQFAATRADATRQEKEQRTKAMRTVADHATDAQDCQRLLVMLGLDGITGEPAEFSTRQLGQIP